MRGKVKRGIALLLSLAMAFSLLSVAAWATGSEERETEENLRAAWDAQQSESAGKKEVQTQQVSETSEATKEARSSEAEVKETGEQSEQKETTAPVKSAKISVEEQATKKTASQQEDTACETMSSSSGVFVGQFEQFEDFPENTVPCAAVIDGTTYYVSTSISEDERAYIIGVLGNLLHENPKSGYSNPNWMVVYRLYNGEIVKLERVLDVLNPTIQISATPNAFSYVNGEFNVNSIPVTVSVFCHVKQKSKFTENELKNVEGLSLTVKKLKLLLDSDIVNFGKKGIFKKEVTEEYEKSIQISLGNSATYEYDIYLKDDYVPDQVTQYVSINGTITNEYGYECETASAKISIGNLDMQQKKAKKAYVEGTVQSMETALSKCTTIALDSGFDYYFTKEQQKEIERFLTIYITEVVNADAMENKDIFENLSNAVRKKIRDKILSKLKVSWNEVLGTTSIECITAVKGKTIYGEQATVTFRIQMNNFKYGDNAPFASLGSFSYSIKGKKIPNGAPTSGDGMATFVNMEQFANEMLSYIKKGYNIGWGEKANKIASMCISSPLDALVLGDFSGNIYNLCERAVKSSVKQVNVYCPVDVYVYDMAGELCGAIVDNQIDTQYGDILLSVSGDEKHIYLSGADYTVKLVGTDSGTMCYEVEEFQDGEKIRTVKTEDIALTDGKTYTGLVSGMCGIDSDTYVLFDEQNNDVPITSDSLQVEELPDGLEKGQTFTIGAITYTVTGIRQVSVTKCDTAYAGDLELSSSVIYEDMCYFVTGIEENAFSGCGNMTSISIPNTVYRVESNAFYHCKGLEKVYITDIVAWCGINFSDGGRYSNPLTYADSLYLNENLLSDAIIPNGVTYIGSGVFYGCYSIKSVTIPASVTAIGGDAFRYCENLDAVYITDLEAWCRIYFNICYNSWDNDKYIASNPLHRAKNLYLNKELVKDLIIPDGVTYIGRAAFVGCNSLTSVTIPDSVESIGEYAFYECGGLISVTIPKSVTSIYDRAFDDCSRLENVYISDVAAWCKIYFVGYEANPLRYANNLYLNGTLVTDVVIPDGVTKISDYLLSCNSLTSVTIPDSVTNIGISAFEGCSSLINAKIPDSVTSIGYNAFSGCSNLSSVTIPDSVTSIARSVFSGCSSLTSVTIPDSVTGIGESAFSGCSSLTSVTIPDSVTSIDKSAFSGCSSLTSVTIPDSVTCIDKSVFSDCSSLTSVTIPDGATSIGYCAFSGCSSLTSVTIPDSVTSIGQGAFSGCSSLTSVTIPDSVTSIDWSAFEDCSSLTSVTIPDSATSVGRYAFEDCSSLTSVTIPDSVTSIDSYAFNGCSSLKDVYYAGSESDWKKVSIGFNNNELINATIHYKSTDPTEKVISTCTINLEKTSYTYDGKAKQPTVTVKDGDTTLTSGKDYEVTYADNTDAGTAKVTITGKGDYSGSVTKEFTIQKANQTLSASISASSIQVGRTAQITASAKTDVSYSSSNAKVAAVSASGVVTAKAVGTATITVTAKASKNYNEASKKVTVTVTEKSVPVTKKLSACKVTLAKTSYTYDGKAKKPAVTVKDGGTTLTNGKDYEVAYANNINAGTAKVTVTGKGNYTGTVTVNVVIKKAASVIIASHITKVTSAKAQKASIGAKVKGGAKLTYKSNNKYVTVDKKGQVTIAKKFVGQATITITAAATKNYNAGTKKVTVTVNPASTKLSSVKNSASKSMKVAWKKNAAVTGYQVQYSTASNFKGAKAVTVKKAATTSTTVKKLTKGKKYYVRVRTYKQVGNKNYYSAWSASKNVTIKK